MEQLFVQLCKVVSDMSKLVQIDPKGSEIQTLRETLSDLFFMNRAYESLRVSVIGVWGMLPHIFNEEIIYAMSDRNANVRLAAIRACTPVFAFRHQLTAQFVGGDLDMRRAIVEMWGKDPVSFDTELKAALVDPELAHDVVIIWGRKPTEFRSHLRKAFRNESVKVRRAIIGAWSIEPTHFRQELVEAFADDDQRIWSAVAAIWTQDIEHFRDEIATHLHTRRP